MGRFPVVKLTDDGLIGPGKEATLLTRRSRRVLTTEVLLSNERSGRRD